VREPDIVARMGGDEFIILLQNVDDGETARASQRIIDTIARPIVLDVSTELNISVTIGSASAPRDGMLPELLLSRADEALYSAKRARRGEYRTYAQRSPPAS
jgi:diguanylate cyclase (GGDEF)-like protein